MENNKLKTKPLTKVIMTIAEVSCKVWYYCRCKLWRQINDFDYYLFDLRSQYPNHLVYKLELADVPLFSRTIDNDDEYERDDGAESVEGGERGEERRERAVLELASLCSGSSMAGGPCGISACCDGCPAAGPAAAPSWPESGLGGGRLPACRGLAGS